MSKPSDKRVRPPGRGAHQSGLRRRFAIDAPNALATMDAIAAIVFRASSCAAIVPPLGRALAKVLPIEAVAVASADDTIHVWLRDPHDDDHRVRAATEAALDCVLGRIDRAAFDATKIGLGQDVAWTTLPLVTPEGAPRGVLVLQSDVALDEGDVAIASFAARAIADRRGPGLARGAASMRTRTKVEAPANAAPMALLSDLTATLFSSLEYTSTISQIARDLTRRRVAACVVDIVEPTGLLRIAEAPRYSAAALDGALSEIVPEVIRSGRPHAVTHSNALSAAWIVSAPLLGVNGTLGALTLVGQASQQRLGNGVVGQLAERVTTAIENGRQYRDALAQVKNRDDALATLSHDLKNPIGAILMNAAYVLKTAREDERRAAGRPQIEAIVRSAKRMRSLVTDLLDLAALDGGAAPIVARPCALRPLLHEVFQTVELVAREDNIALVDELGELPDASIDPCRIVQVLSNIVGNALKFTGPGGSVTARAGVSGREIEVAITDTGRGIGQPELAFIFHRFWRAPAATKSGSGLGLAICKTIIEHSGGRIWAESEVDVGTTIFFTVPIA
jgi:signal transduction histidine kinase